MSGLAKSRPRPRDCVPRQVDRQLKPPLRPRLAEQFDVLAVDVRMRVVHGEIVSLASVRSGGFSAAMHVQTESSIDSKHTPSILSRLRRRSEHSTPGTSTPGPQPHTERSEPWWKQTRTPVRIWSERATPGFSRTSGLPAPPRSEANRLQTDRRPGGTTQLSGQTSR